MILIRGLDHVVIRSADPGAMVAFYRDVLGCNVERELPPDVGLIQLRAGNSLIDIVAVESEIGRMGGAPPGNEGRNMDHFCLRLEIFDEAAIRDHLAQHDVPAGEVQSRYGAEGNGPSLYISDPDGNTVELKGPPDQVA